MRRKVQRPDYRNNGQYQFITGYTGWSNPECVHLTAETITERMTAQHGQGRLVDDGADLWWEQPDDPARLRALESEEAP